MARDENQKGEAMSKVSSEMILMSKALQPLATALDEIIQDHVGKRIGFCLVVFTEGRAQYVSNCDRAEVVAALQELLTRWGQGMPDIKAHEVS